MARKFYAVQVGDNYFTDNGSTIKRKAMAMARAAAKENPEYEVRVVICTTEDDFALAEIIVQKGIK